MTVGFFSDGGPFTFCRSTFHSLTYAVSEFFLESVTTANIVWGNATYGVARWEIEWPRYTAPGTWRTSTIECFSSPSWVRYRVTDAGAATLLDANTTIAQVGPGDILAPLIRAVAMTPVVYTLGTSAQRELRVSLNFTDGVTDTAGVSNVTIRLTAPNGTVITLDWPGQGSLFAGTITAGTVRFTLNFANVGTDQLGTYLVDRMIIRDGTGLEDCLQWSGCILGQSLAVTR